MTVELNWQLVRLLITVCILLAVTVAHVFQIIFDSKFAYFLGLAAAGSAVVMLAPVILGFLVGL